jgi:hypothetical protein
MILSKRKGGPAITERDSITRIRALRLSKTFTRFLENGFPCDDIFALTTES